MLGVHTVGHDKFRITIYTSLEGTTFPGQRSLAFLLQGGGGVFWSVFSLCALYVQGRHFVYVILII